MKNKRALVCIGLTFTWFIFALLAGLREPGFDRDSLSYIDLINRPLEDIWFQEPTFVLIILINTFFFSNSFVSFFLIYAFIGVGIKIYAINKLENYRLLALLTYLLLYYALHDLTQIRVGIASGLFLLSLLYIGESKKKAFLFQLLASLFHYSAIAGMITLFFSYEKINKLTWGGLVLVSVTISKFLTQELIIKVAGILPEFLTVKINNYINMLNLEGLFMNFNQYNFYYLGCVGLFFVALLIYPGKYTPGSDNSFSSLAIIIIKTIGLMITFYYLLAPVPVFAGRFSEFFGIAMIFFIPLLANVLRPGILSIPILLIFISIHAVRLNLDILNF